MSSFLTRRVFCGRIGGAVALALLPGRIAHASPDDRAGLTLGIGNYGMPSVKVEEAIRSIAELGFDSLELSMMPNWDSSPAKLSAARRGALRRLLADNGLALTSLMEDLPPSADDAVQQMSLERLKRAAELGHELSPARAPLIQTVLGGGKWDEKKALFRDRVGDWLRVAAANATVVAVKPHRSGAMSQPLEAAWLFEQLGKPRWLGMVYDYSHYALRNLSIAETVKTALPFTVHIAVKDVALNKDRPEFALPGEAGTIDHGEILSRFYEGGYRGDVCCEVSAQVFRRPGYDATAAAKSCYAYLQKVLDQARIPRRRATRHPESPAP